MNEELIEKENNTEEIKKDNEKQVKEENFEEMLDIKKKDLKKEKSIISRIINIFIWIILIAWMAIVVTDYLQIKKDKEPRFCWFNNKTTEYSDGVVTECTGLGYKVINYKRASMNATEFGPFWTKDRTKDNK